jgi:hypothetical protein
MLIPDPNSDFFPSSIRIPDLGVKKAPDPQHWFYFDSDPYLLGAKSPLMRLERSIPIVVNDFILLV